MLTFVFLFFNHHKRLVFVPTVGLFGSITTVHISIGRRQRANQERSRAPSIQIHGVTMTVNPRWVWEWDRLSAM